MTRPTGVGISFIVSGLVLDLALHYIWQFDYLFPGVGIFGFFLFPVSIVLLIGSAWSWLQSRRESNFLIKLSLSTPGLTAGRLQVNSGSGIISLPEPRELRGSAWLIRRIGITVVLGAAGISVFAGFGRWMRTRTVQPVNMPVSLAQGSIKTGSFYVNLKERYYVSVDLDYSYPETPNCQLAWPSSVLKTFLIVYKDGQPLTGTDGGPYGLLGFFDADKKGNYEAEIQVLSSSACLDVLHPRVRIQCFRDFSDLQLGVSALAGMLLLAAMGLLTRSVAARASDRQSTRRETLAIFQATEYRSYISRPRLRKRFASLPPFGLFAAITFGVGAMLPMYVLEFCFRPVSKGIPVSVLRDAVSTTRSLGVAAPIVIRIKDMGPASNPNLYLNSKPVTWADLPSALKMELALVPNRIVYVHGDDRIPYGDAASVMDIIRGEHAKVVLLTPQTEEFLPAKQNSLPR